jgi:hypothetical protein
VPFRVVVWKVVEWTVRRFYPGAKADDTLPDDWVPPPATSTRESRTPTTSAGSSPTR